MTDFSADHNRYWKRLNGDTWLDLSNGETRKAFDFELSPDSGKKCIVPGLEIYLKKQILETDRLIKLEILNDNRLIRNAFNHLKKSDIEQKILSKITQEIGESGLMECVSKQLADN